MQIQSSFADSNVGKLYLVPTPIGNLDDITVRAKKILLEADYVACEDTRTSGILLDKLGLHKKLLSFHKYNSKQRAPELVQMMQDGAVIAEISDAGMPVISDPGYILVQACIQADIPVISLPGPSAFATALIASGLDAQPFTYYGFLPRKSTQQRPFFEQMKSFNGVSIFYEAPHRLIKTLTTMLQVLGPDQAVVAARELTKIHEEYVRGTLGELVDHFTQTPPKGEFVILVGPSQVEQKPVELSELLPLIDQQVERGVSKKDAIKQVASEYQVSKNDLYDAYHAR